MTWAWGHLSRNAYDVIVIDPPWRLRHWNDTNQAKSASRHYSLMTTEAIAALPVADLAAPNCLILEWATAPMLPHALDCMRSWGFQYSSRMAWRKTTINGKVRVGTGYWVRTMHEDVLIGRRGKPKLARALPSIFDGLAREHSRKPDRFYDLVADATPGARRVELFARMGHLGFAAWGDEAGKFDVAA